jgi:hypothetical protein
MNSMSTLKKRSLRLLRPSTESGRPTSSAGGVAMTTTPAATSEMDHLDQLGAKAFDG